MVQSHNPWEKVAVLPGVSHCAVCSAVMADSDARAHTNELDKLELYPNPRSQFLIAAQATTILRRAGHLARQAHRSRRWIIENVFDHQHVLPSVAEVVVIEQPVALTGDHLIQAHTVLDETVVAFAEIKSGDEVGTGTPVRPDTELMQMTVLPAIATCSTSCSSSSTRSPGRTRRRQIGGLAYIRSTRTRKPRTRSGTAPTSGVGSSNTPANKSRPASAISCCSIDRSTPPPDTALFLLLFRFSSGTHPANQTPQSQADSS